MSRLSGQLAPQNVGPMQTAQQTTGAKVKEFFVSIGHGLAKAGKAVAHFFGTSVPSFFKSLGQRTATQVATTDAPRFTGITGGAFDKSVDVGAVNWSHVQGFEAKGSGHGGVVIANFGGTNAVIKGGGGLANNEVLGSRLARAVGLPAPETRLLSDVEKEEIANQLAQHNESMPHRSDGSEPALVMEHVNAVDMGDAAPQTPGEAKALAASLGKWLAFDAIISEQDRFNCVRGMGNGVNTGNFLVNPSNPGEIIGIDQNVMSTDSSQTLNSIMEGSEYFFEGLGNDFCDKFPELGLNGLEVGNLIKQSAQDMLKHIGATIDDATVDQFTNDLSLNSGIAPALKERLALAAEYAQT